MEVNFWFGSQTGNAEAIAHRLYDEFRSHSFAELTAAGSAVTATRCLPLSAFQQSAPAETETETEEAAGATTGPQTLFERPHIAIIITSTTGNGDAPENAHSFWRYLRKKEREFKKTQKMQSKHAPGTGSSTAAAAADGSLGPSGLRQHYFTVLALGDSNYDKFCHVGKVMDRCLGTLEAQRFFELGLADEEVGMEDGVEPWCEQLWPALRRLIHEKQQQAETRRSMQELSGRPKRAPNPATATALATAPSPPGSVSAVALPSKQGQTHDSQRTNGTSNSSGTGVGIGEPTEQREEKADANVRVAVPASVDGRKSVRRTTSSPPLPPSTSAQERVQAAEVAATPSLCLPRQPSAHFPRQSVRRARVRRARYLTAGGAAAERRVVYVEFDIADTGIEYQPGDTLGLICPSKESDVTKVLQRLALHPESPSADELARRIVTSCKLPNQCTLQEALSRHLDVTSPPRPNLLQFLAQHCADMAERELLERLGTLTAKGCCSDEYDRHIKQPRTSLGELLDLLPSCRPPFAQLLSRLPSMQARYYSVCSSPLKDPTSVAITFSVAQIPCVRYPWPLSAQGDGTRDGDGDGGGGGDGNGSSSGSEPVHFARGGLCTTWLEHQLQDMLKQTGKSATSETAHPDEEQELESARMGANANSGMAAALAAAAAGPFGARRPMAASVTTGSDATDESAGASTTELAAPSSLSAPAAAYAAAAAAAAAGACSNLDGKTSASSSEAARGVVQIPLFLRPTKEFLLPASKKWPLILVGPGTGVAPFMAFLEHRFWQRKLHEEESKDVCCGYWRGGYEVGELEELQAEELASLDSNMAGSYAFSLSQGIGPISLYFGCRRRNTDWIFKDEMLSRRQDGTLTALYTAFSRDTPNKVYVQHRMQETGAELVHALVEQGAYLYVCGDAKSMAADVHITVRRLLVEHNRMTEDAAEDFLTDLKHRSRYHVDAWT